jgi:hypothetical protein
MASTSSSRAPWASASNIGASLDFATLRRLIAMISPTVVEARAKVAEVPLMPAILPAACARLDLFPWLMRQ